MVMKQKSRKKRKLLNAYIISCPLLNKHNKAIQHSMNKEGIKKLESQVDSLLTLFMRAYSQYLFQRPMMVNTNLISRMGMKGKRRGFEHLRNQLYWNLIQEIVKICDDSDERTPCIKKITSKLENKNTLKILEDIYSNQAYPRVEGEDYATWEKLQRKYQLTTTTQ